MKLKSTGEESPIFHHFSHVALPTRSSCLASYTSKGRRKGTSCPDSCCLSCTELDMNYIPIRSSFQQATHGYMTPHHLAATSYRTTKSAHFKWVACPPLLKRVMSYSFIPFPSLDDQLLIKTIFCYAKYFLKRALYQTRNDLRTQLKFWIDFQGFEKMGQCRWKKGKSRTSKAIISIGLLTLCKQVFCWKGYHYTLSNNSNIVIIWFLVTKYPLWCIHSMCSSFEISATAVGLIK